MMKVFDISLMNKYEIKIFAKDKIQSKQTPEISKILIDGSHLPWYTLRQ